MSAQDARSDAPWQWVHLLWAIPLALIIGWGPVVYAQFSRCGIHACVGELKGWESPYAALALLTAAFAGFLLAVAIFVVPWVRSRWVRAAAALLAGAALTAFWIYNILFI